MWGDVYFVLDEMSYVVVGGCVFVVGIGGYIFGGGYSMLLCVYGGLVCDKVLFFFMVIVDGKKLVKVFDKENLDFFWVLKGGGGGNFGVLVDVILEVCLWLKKFIWSWFIYDFVEESEKGFDVVGKNLDKFFKELNFDMVIYGYFGKKILFFDVVYFDIYEDEVKLSFKVFYLIDLLMFKEFILYL